MPRSAALFVSVLTLAGPVRAREVSVPMALDHAFLRRALVEQVFTDPGETARIWDDGAGCNSLVLAAPRVDRSEERLRITSAAEARLGVRVGESCVGRLEWKGSIETLAEAYLDEQAPLVHLRVVDSSLRGAAGQKGATGTLWGWVKRYVHPRFEAVTVDLRPALDDLRSVLPLVLAAEDAARITRVVDSVALARVESAANGLAVQVRFDIPAPGPVTPSTVSPGPEPTLSPAEIERWEQALERWDAFLTFVVKGSARDTGLAELRAALLDVLLDSRHGVLEALAPSEPAAPDPTRRLFVSAWERLAPVLRDVSADLPGEQALRYLSFVTAADALGAIDELGPESGLDISADGLRRLARMLIPTFEDPLSYTVDVDGELRELFGFGLPLDPPAEPGLDLSGWLAAPAWAAAGPPPDLLARLNRWVPTREEIGTYLPLVRDLLHATVDLTLARKPLAESYRPVYRWLVLAASWQESCWRQFVRIGSKVSPITSPVGSVGLMQVNQKVWRGFYDVGGLRQDIGYNARAGAEILLHYLKDYAIAKREHETTGNVDNLARATYSAYNAGPGQLARYRRPNVAPRARRVDESFASKYRAMKAGNEMAVAECYGK